MYTDLICNEKKVFSAQLKPPDAIEPILSKIKQKEDLSTAILLLNGGEQSVLLFILENRLYAPYCHENDRFKPLLFSDYFKQVQRSEGILSLYQVSPVLFKSLLLLAQVQPSLVMTNRALDIEWLLSQIKKNKKEAVLALKNNKEVNLYYFFEGELRDAYLQDTKKIKISDLKDRLWADTSSTDDSFQIEVFDSAEIQPAQDVEDAENKISAIQADSSEDDKDEHIQGDEAQDEITGDPDLSDDEQTPLPDSLLFEETADQEKTAGLCIEVLTGSRTGFLIRQANKPIVLGRGNVDVRLNDPQISRQHAELEWTTFGLVVRDCNSTNGLFVNDIKLGEKKLTLNDEIRLGNIRLKVVLA